MKTSVIGYPRVGSLRELKFATEKYFKNSISQDELQDMALNLRRTHWKIQRRMALIIYRQTTFHSMIICSILPFY